MRHLLAAAWEGIDVKCRLMRGTRGGRSHKRLVSALSSQPIPLLSSPNAIPNPPAPCAIRLWWASLFPLGERRPRVAPTPTRHWVTAAGWWGAKQGKCNWGSIWPDRHEGCPGDIRCTTVGATVGTLMKCPRKKKSVFSQFVFSALIACITALMLMHSVLV